MSFSPNNFDGIGFCLGVALLNASCATAPPQRQTGPELVFPVHFAERSAEAPKAAPQEAEPAPLAPTRAEKTALPDPEPLRLSEQWEYQVELERGEVRVVSVQHRSLPKPQVTSRKIGRYAIELWIGRELIERVRFDFPLRASELPETGRRKPLHPVPSLAQGLHMRERVWVPASPRATRAVLLDRATGRAEQLPWPPEGPLDTPETPETR